MFCFHLSCFLQSHYLVSPIQDPIGLLKKTELTYCFQLLSIVSNDSEFIRFKKMSASFWNFKMIYPIFVNFRHSLSKNKRNQFTSSYEL